MKKIICGFIAAFSFFAFALDPIKTNDYLKDSADLANRRTALRCLSNATNYASENKFEEARSQAKLGISYDENISDLWYILACAEASLGTTMAETLPMLEKSLGLGSWVNYNRDNARLMAADILCETGNSKKALELLDSVPSIYSADAEFIRVKSYYRIKSEDSVSKARNKIDGARRIYPQDTRFPLVFFKNENPEKLPSSLKYMADYFLDKISQYQEASPDKNAELEIYAAAFARGEAQKRMLMSFSARSLRHPMYAYLALKSGVFNQQQAFEYFTEFADREVDVSFLRNLISVIDQKDVRDFAKKYFAAFDGSLVEDTDGDGNPNLLVKYNRGRPQEIYYDMNHDGKIDWEINCDFGVPVSGKYRETSAFEWSQFPYLLSFSFQPMIGEISVNEKFTFIGESVAWTPILMEREDVVSEFTGEDFFYPAMSEETTEVSENEFLESASSFVHTSRKSTDTEIHFLMDHGKVVQAMYFENGVIVGQAQFEDNIPVLRIVDSDRDGIFESTEFYELKSSPDHRAIKMEEEREIMQSLFGVPSNGAEFYLRMVQMDRNNDTVPDVTTEYFEDGTEIVSWDDDADGNWNEKYISVPETVNADGSVIPAKKQQISKLKFNGLPVSLTRENDRIINVQVGNEILVALKGDLPEFYWLVKSETSLDADKIQFEKAAMKKMGVNSNVADSCVIEIDGKSCICTKYDRCYYILYIDFNSVKSDLDDNSEPGKTQK